MPEFLRQVLIHPATAAAGIAAVTAALLVFVLRVSARSWVPPTVVGMALCVEAIATISAVRAFIVPLRQSPPPMAQAGLPQVATTILESRAAGVVGAVVLLALAAVGLASIFASGPAPADGDPPPAPHPDRVRASIAFAFSVAATLLVAVLAFWEARQASSIVRAFAASPLDFRLLHGDIALGVGSLGFLCLLCVAGGLVLTILAQALASAERPTAAIRRGNAVLLCGTAFVAVASLAAGASQRSWLRGIVATGKVPGVVPKMATASAKIPPCRPHPPGTGVANAADVNEPIVLERVPPKYPEFARRQGVHGDVLLEAVVEKDGTVSFVCVLRGLDPALDEAAANAVLQWQYRPATRRSDGTPVPVYLPVTVTFRLE